jgi:beta-aspartyl-peptidase (threonine type)
MSLFCLVKIPKSLWDNYYRLLYSNQKHFLKDHMILQKAIALVFILSVLPLANISIGQTATAKDEKPLRGPQKPKLGFVIHGGAGVIRKGSLTPEMEKQYREKLEEAVMAGYRALQEGKKSLDAVEIAIRIMEDSPLFNAGKGAVFTHDGKNELDASIMDGKTLKAGAVAGLHRVKNPITLARAVMEKSEHVMLIGEGAEQFAAQQKIELVDPSYFWTKPRWDALQRILKQEKEQEEKNKPETNQQKKISQNVPVKPLKEEPYNKFGTVGAVALDIEGNLAAGTSTGGMTNKKWGRVGDAPIIGAGTYANNASCAVSSTGWGEFFIRLTIARDIAALVEYRGLSVQQAADLVIKDKLQKLGGDGGVIVLDRNGNIGISFNSEGMYRAYIDENGKPVVEIYGSN